MAALEIRKDRTPAVLQRAAKAESDARAARRMLAIVMLLPPSRKAASRLSKCGRAVFRWRRRTGGRRNRPRAFAAGSAL